MHRYVIFAYLLGGFGLAPYFLYCIFFVAVVVIVAFVFVGVVCYCHLLLLLLSIDCPWVKFSWPQSDLSLKNLASTGANSVAIVVTQFQTNIK